MDDVARVRERLDIVSLISEYIPLKKMGRNFKALCPFHTEKTPSFVVSPERQIWHCFGCSKGGDAFTFLMEYEKLEFVEALRILAKKAGITLRESNFQKGLSSKKEQIYQLNRLALGFYHYVLTNHQAGKKALSYLLHERKLNLDLIETFRLGFAPGSNNALSNFLINKKGYKREDLIEAGLAFYPSTSSRQARVLDFFRNRVIFPLFDHRGNIAGFSGRATEAISTDFFGGKYINTRETIAYHKGTMFFGLNIAKEEIKKNDRAIIVEGEFDAISLFQEGIKNVVAIKGTALTYDQVALISRFTQNISLCFDNDPAGYEATKRSLEVLDEKGMVVNVVDFKKGKDPDEAIKTDPISFKNAVKKSIGIYDYLFARAFDANNKKTIDGKRQISSEVLPIFATIGNEIVKEHYLRMLSNELETSYESIIKEVEKREKRQVVKNEVPMVRPGARGRREILEEYLLSLIIQGDVSPKALFVKARSILQDYKFEILSYQKLMDAFSVYFQGQENFDSKKFINTLPNELIKSFDTCFLSPIPKFSNSKKIFEEVEKVAKELRLLFLKNKIQVLTASLKKEEKEQDAKRIEAFEKEVLILSKLLRSQNVVK